MKIIRPEGEVSATTGNRFGRRTVLEAGVAAATAAIFGPRPAAGAFVTNADAVKGTWVLLQASSVAELDNAMAGALGRALSTPHIVGFSHRVTWESIDQDFSLLQRGYDIATSRGLLYSPRFMAGRWTPDRVFSAGCPYYLKSGTNEKVPRPFNTDGSPNIIFENEWNAFVGRLEGWCRNHGIRLMHLAWYGQDWAELNHGAEVRALQGYTYAHWLNAHQRLLGLGLTHADAYLAVEFPFSGYGPLSSNTGSPVARDLAAYVINSIGVCRPRFFCQANGWGPTGDWGAPTAETEAAFDSDVWPKQLYRGQQMIQPQDYDNWPGIFQHLYTNKATYCEIYAQSFYTNAGAPQPHLAQLQGEISSFKNYVLSATPVPPGC
jgi:hypothetical protein